MFHSERPHAAVFVILSLVYLGAWWSCVEFVFIPGMRSVISQMFKSLVIF